MKKFIFVLAVSFMGSISCKDKEQTVANETANQQTAVVAQDGANDSAEIRTVITDFYNWYNKNYTKFETYKLYSSIKKKDEPPYKMNWDVVEKYQQFIRDSVPQLGEEFINNQKHFFQQCDSAFKVDVEDEIPYGFDYDWYTNSQEDPQYLVDEINKSLAWAIKWSGDLAWVDIKTAYDDNGKNTTETAITIIMKKENGKWKIAKTWSE